MVVLEVRSKNALEVAFVEHNHMIQALTPNRSDQALNVWILPGRTPRRDDLFNAHVRNAILEMISVDAISITNHKPWRLIFRERLYDLLRRPLGRRMGGDVEVNKHPSIMTKDNEGEQYAESSGRNSEEVDCDDVLQVVVKECSPGW